MAIASSSEQTAGHVAYACGGARRHAAMLLPLGCILVIAAFFRFSCFLGEAWLDEVWTWNLSEKLTWPGGIFYQLREENNHYLNTLVVWLLRDWRWPWWRVPPMLCGLGTVAIAWLLGRSHAILGSRASWIAGGLTAVSYLEVHYSSEARGYAYAAFFAGLAYWRLQSLDIAQSTLGTPRPPRSIPTPTSWFFTVACVGGFLSQPVFLSSFCAMAVWIGLRRWRVGCARRVVVDLFAYFGPAGYFFVCLYVIDLHHAVNAGGDRLRLPYVIVQTLSLSGGGPFDGWGAWVVATLVVAFFAWGLRTLARAQDDRWILHLCAVVLPVVLLLVLRRLEVYPRYFLVAVFFLIQAAAVGLADLLRRGLLPRTLAAAALVAQLWGNGLHVVGLARLGRGSYLPVLEALRALEPSSVIQLQSDSDFRHRLMFKYYLPKVDLTDKQFQYVSQEEVPAAGTNWLLLHSLELKWQPRGVVSVRGVAYQLQLLLPYHGLSGWSMALYRRLPIAVLLGSTPQLTHPCTSNRDHGCPQYYEARPPAFALFESRSSVAARNR